ncbi:Kynurenine aminotransferase, partial [Operophtera brumata]
VEYIQLAAEYKPAVNLGQGFPDYHAPKHVTQALSEITGHPRLVQNLSKIYSPLIGREIDPINEILVTSGAYEALFSAILEPFFDCYDFMIKSASGVPKFIALKPKKTSGTVTSADWELDFNELASLFNERTKMIILNTPHNPLGKAFTQSELEQIAALCKKHNALCLSDEVYEWMTFSVTGWKTGWAYGPASLMKNLQVEAVARSFEVELARINSPDCYLYSLARELLPKRDYLLKILRDNGFNPTFAKEAGVLAIPPTAFYSEGHKHLGEDYARFCFI